MKAAPVVLAAGGTGGHVFPAEALASELRRRGHRVALLTDTRGRDYEARFPGVEIHAVRAGTPSGRGWLGRFAAIGEIIAGTFAAHGLLKRLRPAVAVGFGGYPSVPPMLAATRIGVPTLLHEQNAVLGRANRLLAPRVTSIAGGFAELKGLKPADRGKLRVTGNPVREAISALREVPYTAPNSHGPIRLLVLGGSQGATVLSQVLPAALLGLPAKLKDRLRITQQCRREDLERVRRAYAGGGVSADLETFIEDVPALLASAHLCITRAGASTVAELSAAGRPAVLVPYPHATDDHQSANARALAAAGGAFVMPQARFTETAVRDAVAALLEDPLMLARMAEAARGQGRPRAAAELADLVEALVPGNGCAADCETGRAAA